MKLVFLCSGGGGNVRFVDAVIARGFLRDHEIVEVISDRPCGANMTAQRLSIKHQIMDFAQDAQGAVSEALARHGQDVLTITTVHRILVPEVADRFQGRLLNVHYSILPAFGGSIGSKPLESALDYGAKWTGATVHHVTPQVDMGAPICQGVLPVIDGVSFERIMDLVFRAGCLALLASLVEVSGGAGPKTPTPPRSVVFGDVSLHLNPGMPGDSSWATDETFWDLLRT